MSAAWDTGSQPDVTPPDVAGRRLVLVGVDGSNDALRAVRYARGVAERTGADVWLVHAVDDAALSGGYGMVFDPSVLEDVGREALKSAQAVLAEDGFDPRRVKAEVMIGHPAAVMADLSEHAELLVLGRRASGGVERMFVGSTSVALASTSACPLVVISAASNPGPTGRWHRIAAAVTTPGKSEKTLRFALREAASREASLDVVHVVAAEPKGLFARGGTDAGRRLAEAKDRIGTTVQSLRDTAPGVDVSATAKTGVLLDELIALSTQVDLLVLGVHPHPVTGLTFGGVVRGVLAHAQCPVALVRS